MNTKIFYIWWTDDEGGYGVCKKDNFIKYKNTSVHEGVVEFYTQREALFEFSTRDEFIEKLIQVCPEEKDCAEKLADIYCNNLE